jgi:putative ABC transport system substrate-binding protein
MKRRTFITLVGGAAAWPLSARAQQPAAVRRIGVLMNLAADDREGHGRLAAFLDGLAQSGWNDGRNLRIEIRWGAGDPDRFPPIRNGARRACTGGHPGWLRGNHARIATGDP